MSCETGSTTRSSDSPLPSKTVPSRSGQELLPPNNSNSLTTEQSEERLVGSKVCASGQMRSSTTQASRIASKMPWSTHAEFQASSVRLTVQGRVVYFEGCATRPELAAELEQFARSLPRVMQAIASIRTRPNTKSPYAVWPQPGSNRR